MAYFYTRWVSLYLLFLLFFFSPGTLLTRLIRVECTLFRNISSSLILATNPCSYSADNIFNANSSSAFSTYFCSIAYIWACRAQMYYIFRYNYLISQVWKQFFDFQLQLSLLPAGDQLKVLTDIFSFITCPCYYVTALFFFKYILYPVKFLLKIFIYLTLLFNFYKLFLNFNFLTCVCPQLIKQYQIMFDLTSQERAYLIFGGALTLIAYTIDLSLRKQSQKNYRIMQEIKDWRDQSKKWPYFDKLKKPQNKNKKCKVVLEKVFPKSTNSSILIRTRQAPLHLRKKQFFQNVSGGSFNFTYLNNDVVVQIDNALVMNSILAEKSQEVQIFGKMQPVVKKIEYFLRKGQPLAIVGALSYDIAAKKFKIQPFAMGYDIPQIIEYFERNYYAATIPRGFIIVLGLLGIWLSWKPVKKIVNKIKSKLLWWRSRTEQERLLQFSQKIKKKIQIKARKQHAYECVSCLANPTEIVYNCGHLCVCQACDEKNKQKNGGIMICPICKKKSQYKERIYFG